MQARYQATLQPEPENGQKDPRAAARQELSPPDWRTPAIFRVGLRSSRLFLLFPFHPLPVVRGSK